MFQVLVIRRQVFRKNFPSLLTKNRLKGDFLMSDERPKIVIVGGGFGGIKLAKLFAKETFAANFLDSISTPTDTE
jgi:hypothetical protein